VTDTLKNLLAGLVGPDALHWIGQAWHLGIVPLLSEPRLRLALLASTLAVVLLFYLLGRHGPRTWRGFLGFTFPREVWLHRSALLDYRFYVVNQLLMGHLRFGRWVVGLVALLGITDTLRLALDALFGPRAADVLPGPVALGVFTVVNLLAWDFAKYVAHWLTHKVPELWEFHKVHHATEVLTPISAFRAHPVDIMIDFFMRLVFTGVVGGVFAHLYPGGIAELTILGFNAVAFVLYYWIAHLQHSHVRLGYGWASRLLVSPLMHQVHHSQEVHHWDRNFGFLFGLWDWMFGTLVITDPKESFRLGLPGGVEEYRTVRQLYVRPFTGLWARLGERARRLVGRRSPA
jgi:sterol desaturase/sphingolipid hydroxylase (fatty acid hydroxylase superfamily)